MGGAAVGGLTDAAVAQEKELQNEKQAEVLAKANAAYEEKKDAVDASYRQEINALNQQQAAMKGAQANAVAQAAGGVSNALMQGAMATFSGTKVGQSWFGGAGEGSPGGGGVNPGTVRSYVNSSYQSPLIQNPSMLRYYLDYGVG